MRGFGRGSTGVGHLWRVVFTVSSLHQNDGGSLSASWNGFLLPQWVGIGEGGIKPSGELGTHALHLWVMLPMLQPGSFKVLNLSSS